MTRSLANLTLLAVLVANPVRAQLVPLFGEFQVNAYTTGAQYELAVASDAGGRFVVVWRSVGSAGSDTSGSSIQGQRYDATGAALGGQFQVNTYTTSSQINPAVAADPAGNFVVAWRSYGSVGSDSDGASIQGQRYFASGSPRGGQFQINSYTTNSQYTPAVAIDQASNVVVVWSSVGSAGSDTDLSSLQGQRYDAADAALGGQFQVNSYTTGAQYRPAVSADASGNFVVAWTSGGSPDSDTSGHSVQAQRYAGTGAALGGQFQVNSYTTSSQYAPAVSADASGNFVVAWTSGGSPGSDGTGYSVQGQRYDATGAPVGAQFQVNSYTTGTQRNPAVSADAGGAFVVAWRSDGSVGSDTSSFSIQGQRYDGTGTVAGSQFQVNTYTTSGQSRPAVTGDGVGNFVVAWDSDGSAGSDASGSSIQGQRYVSGRAILGMKILVKDPLGSEPQRTVIVLGKESATDIGPAIVGDPVTSGATLRVIAKGTTDSDQTYVLDAAGWTAAGTAGFKYSGPTGGDGDPVKKVIIRRTPGGTALVKTILKGSVGTQSLDVVPPSFGDEGGIILTINGGGTYCAAFGGAAGGLETDDVPKVWKIIKATAQGCPTP